MATYQQNKNGIYKWRMANLDHNREINKKSKRRHDAWKKIQRTFLAILLI
jgi:hypothetical protein